MILFKTNEFESEMRFAILFLLFLANYSFVNAQQLFYSNIDLSQKDLSELKAKDIKIYSSVCTYGSRKEKKHNKSMNKMLDTYGKHWRDSVISSATERPEKQMKALEQTQLLMSINGYKYEKRKSYNLYFDKDGFITRKKYKLRSNKRFYIVKEWRFNKKGDLLQKTRHKVFK